MPNGTELAKTVQAPPVSCKTDVCAGRYCYKCLVTWPLADGMHASWPCWKHGLARWQLQVAMPGPSATRIIHDSFDIVAV